MSKGREAEMPALLCCAIQDQPSSDTRNKPMQVPAIVPGMAQGAGPRRPLQIIEADKFHRFVVIEFPKLRAGVACFQSDELQQGAHFSAERRGRRSRHHVDAGHATK